MSSVGVPVKVLHEAAGHIVTMEVVTGEIYRGKLLEVEDNMNCQLQNITMTKRDGRVSQLEQIFVRGSKIRFVILPDMLKNAPMFKKMLAQKSGGVGRGKSALLKAQVAARGRGGDRGGYGGPGMRGGFGGGPNRGGFGGGPNRGGFGGDRGGGGGGRGFFPRRR